MKKPQPVNDARLEKYYAERISAPRPTRQFYVVDCRGAIACNPVSEKKAHAYMLEFDQLCPSYAPHKIVQVFIGVEAAALGLNDHDQNDYDQHEAYEQAVCARYKALGLANIY
jgi:hypothetical protein